MKIDSELIRKIAKNARLKLTDKEIKEFTPQLKEILDFFSELDKVDTKNTKETFQPIELKNVMRKDKVEEGLSQEEALKNTVNKKEGYFRGPKAL